MISFSMMKEDIQTRVTLHLVCSALSSTGKFHVTKDIFSYSEALLLCFMFLGDGTV
jgi:hypothetical protein